MSLLKPPSVKLLAKHLKYCEIVSCCQNQKNITSSKPGLNIWKCSLPEGSINFSVLWIQGHLSEVADFGKIVLINDGTGQVKLSACDRVTAKPEMKRGMYIMAVGTMVGSPENPEIKPFKLQDLSHIECAQEMWHLEVMDQIHHLTHLVQS